MLKIKNPQFVKSILDVTERPKPFLPEFAFVGRSNVGKSSLINCLVNIHNFARVSKKPGKTRTINYFRIDNRFYLVDLPGYGFAKTSRSEQSIWRRRIEDYLIKNAYLKLLFVLIDSKVGAKENDLQLIAWLRFHEIPFQIIAMKVDQISRNIREKQEKSIREKLAISPDHPPILFSAKTREGREEVLRVIKRVLGKSPGVKFP